MEALATETADTEGVGMGTGMVTTVYALAFVIGSFAGGSISGLFGLRPAFLVYFGMACLSILTVWLVKDPERPRIPNPSSGHPFSSKLSSRSLVLGYYLGASETFGFATVMALLSVYAAGFGIPVFWIGIVFSIFWAGRILSGMLAGGASDRFGRRRVAFVAFMVGCTGFVVIALARDLLFLATGGLLVGLSIGAIYPVNLAMIADKIEPELRGGAMGIYEMTCAITFMIASALGGVAAEALNPRTPYAFSAFVFLCCAVALQLWIKLRKSEK